MMIERRSRSSIYDKAQTNLTVDQYCDTFMGDQIGGGAREYLDVLREKGLYIPEIGRALIEVHQRFGTLRAIRFLNYCCEKENKGLNEPGFDFSTYYRLYLEAPRELGKRGSGHFFRQYLSMLDLGFTGEEYYSLVVAARDANSKMFASWYATLLPKYLNTSVTPANERKEAAVRFRAAAGKVFREGTLKVAIPFMDNASSLEEQGLSLSAFADFAVTVNMEFGKNVSPWIVKSMGGVCEMGYEPDCYINDIRQIYTSHGEKAALWYAYGIMSVIGAKGYYKHTLRVCEAKLKKGGDLQGLNKELLETQTIIGNIDIPFFRSGYFALLSGIGKTTANAYVFLLRNPSLVSQIALHGKLDTLVDRLFVLYHEIDKKVFYKALWFVPKSISDPLLGFEEVKTLFLKKGREATIAAILYTHGIARKNKYTCPHLVSPEETPRGSAFLSPEEVVIFDATHLPRDEDVPEREFDEDFSDYSGDLLGDDQIEGGYIFGVPPDTFYDEISTDSDDDPVTYDRQGKEIELVLDDDEEGSVPDEDIDPIKAAIKSLNKYIHDHSERRY